MARFLHIAPTTYNLDNKASHRFKMNIYNSNTPDGRRSRLRSSLKDPPCEEQNAQLPVQRLHDAERGDENAVEGSTIAANGRSSFFPLNGKYTQFFLLVKNDPTPNLSQLRPSPFTFSFYFPHSN